VIPLIFNLGPTELIIILVIVLLLFGGSRLAGLGKSTGRALKEFKEETKGLRDKDEPAEPAQPPAATPAMPALGPNPGAPTQTAPGGTVPGTGQPTAGQSAAGQPSGPQQPYPAENIYQQPPQSGVQDSTGTDVR
jgi:sec-independent protein translocase protein TatA